MALIKHAYNEKELRDLGPEIKIQIGSDLHILRPVKPEIVAEANARIQKRIDLSYSKPTEILKRANANRRAGTIILNC